MRYKRVLAIGAVTAMSGAAAASADHVQPVDPATVPDGTLASHIRVNRLPVADLVRAARERRWDVFIQQGDLPPNLVLPWHTHPGPAVLSVVSGSLIVEEGHGRSCRRRTYRAGRGFVDRGSGHVHRAIAGPEGAKTYVVYLHPRGTENPTTPASPPRGCAG